jgi:hypothetical protein
MIEIKGKLKIISEKEAERLMENEEEYSFGDISVFTIIKKDEFMNTKFFMLQLDDIFIKVKKRIYNKIIKTIKTSNLVISWKVYEWNFKNFEIFRHEIVINSSKEEITYFQVYFKGSE